MTGRYIPSHVPWFGAGKGGLGRGGTEGGKGIRQAGEGGPVGEGPRGERLWGRQ